MYLGRKAHPPAAIAAALSSPPKWRGYHLRSFVASLERHYSVTEGLESAKLQLYKINGAIRKLAREDPIGQVIEQFSDRFWEVCLDSDGRNMLEGFDRYLSIAYT